LEWVNIYQYNHNVDRLEVTQGAMTGIAGWMDPSQREERRQWQSASSISSFSRWRMLWGLQTTAGKSLVPAPRTAPGYWVESSVEILNINPFKKYFYSSSSSSSSSSSLTWSSTFHNFAVIPLIGLLVAEEKIYLISEFVTTLQQQGENLKEGFTVEFEGEQYDFVPHFTDRHV
jgi:hypothetical protein